MVLIYTLLLVALGTAHFLVKRRTAALEKKFVRVARQADAVLRLTATRPGNCSRHDAYEAAKRQYLLALLATKRDRIEARYTKWQARSERLAKVRARIRAWKGRKVPYTMGALDVVGALALIDYLGAGRYVNARGLVDAIATLLHR
jgi:hypothetical protein